MPLLVFLIPFPLLLYSTIIRSMMTTTISITGDGTAYLVIWAFSHFMVKGRVSASLQRLHTLYLQLVVQFK